MDMAVKTDGQKNKVAQLINRLHEMAAKRRHTPKLGGWPHQLEQLATLPLWVAAVGILLLLVAAGVSAAGMFPFPKLSAQLIGLFIQAMALIALALQTVGGAAGSWLEHRHGGRILAARGEHDVGLARELLACDQMTLDLGDRWLESETKRIEARLGMFFGGVDKVALFALVGIGWSVAAEIQKGVLAAYPYVTACGIAALAGLALGGLVSRGDLHRLLYQRDLIAISNLLREKQKSS